MKIFGMGIVELLIVLVIVGVLFGPRLLKLGPTFKKTGNALREGIDEEESRPSANAPAQPRPVATAKPAANASTAKAAAPVAAASASAASAASQQQASQQPAKKSNVGRIVSIVAVVLLLVALVLRLTGVWQ
ncbi:MAG: twin-arginine translocase TatA/TatE family subunit [Eggerthellaceae bacterium]|nr:twin-arginine translocase TatA/TatE family subunit [Eggerthellaceae bacterium]MBR3258145.1 twin-arginine translocase TatA/TatE family subunit [Eggerthellaceae bacterium]